MFCFHFYILFSHEKNTKLFKAEITQISQTIKEFKFVKNEINPYIKIISKYLRIFSFLQTVPVHNYE